jgi:hypothetical protein
MSHTELSNYPTDLTDEQWQILRKLLPQRSSSRGAAQTVCRRGVRETFGRADGRARRPLRPAEIPHSGSD